MLKKCHPNLARNKGLIPKLVTEQEAEGRIGNGGMIMKNMAPRTHSEVIVCVFHVSIFFGSDLQALWALLTSKRSTPVRWLIFLSPQLTKRVAPLLQTLQTIPKAPNKKKTSLPNELTMHVEIQIALNFIISYLYHKLPRRRVNLFGEELERALKERFQGHWYPREPTRGSAFRCVRTGLPVDPVLAQAARDSGVAIEDLQEALPEELAVWIDPGEVSYRIGERGVVKILYSETNCTTSSTHDEATPTFNPEAQSFCPSSASSSSAELCAAFNTLSLSRDPSPYGSLASLPSPSEPEVPSARSPKPLTFTTAAFAQTKFGSTKLKNSSKRGHRLSPTEFALYLKQRQQQQPPVYLSAAPMRPAPRPRSLSPSPYSHDSVPNNGVTLLLPSTNGFLSPSPVSTPCPSPAPSALPETSTSTPNIWSDYSSAVQGKYVGNNPLHLLVANS